MQRAQVRSLVRELRSCISHDVAKKKKKNKKEKRKKEKKSYYHESIMRFLNFNI